MTQAQFDNSKPQPTQQGDDAWRRREQARRHREWTMQAVMLIVVVGVVWLLAGNVSDNLAERNIRSGFAFLMNSAGFDIGESAIAFSSGDALWRAFCVGILNTVRVALLSIATATVLGVVVGMMRIAKHPIINALGTAHVEVYRNIPLIIQLFAVYLLITELLPMSTEALSFGSWALLSKAGLQFTVPEQSGLAVFACGIDFVLVTLWIREKYRRQVTDLVANLMGLGVGLVFALLVWIIFGGLSGWDHPVINGFSIEGGASLSPEFLALWIGLTVG